MGGILKVIQGAFAFVNAWMRKGQQEADMKAGANEREITAHNRQDEVRKDKEKVRAEKRDDTFTGKRHR